MWKCEINVKHGGRGAVGLEMVGLWMEMWRNMWLERWKNVKKQICVWFWDAAKECEQNVREMWNMYWGLVDLQGVPESLVPWGPSGGPKGPPGPPRPSRWSLGAQGAHRSPWTPMGSNNPPQGWGWGWDWGICMDIYGYLWMSMDIHEHPWISLDIHGCP